MTAIGTVGLVNLTLEELVFGVDEPSFPRAPNAEICQTKMEGGEKVELTESEREECLEEREEEDRRYKSNRIKRELAQDIALLIAGVPLFIFGWRSAKKAT
jgi:hypothetical protein